mgnify:CR=1 FL=1
MAAIDAVDVDEAAMVAVKVHIPAVAIAAVVDVAFSAEDFSTINNQIKMAEIMLKQAVIHRMKDRMKTRVAEAVVVDSPEDMFNDSIVDVLIVDPSLKVIRDQLSR